MHVRISDLSEQTGVSLRSLRYYEKKGLISPRRLPNGYRVYEESDVEKVRKIQFYLEMGATTDEIAQFIRCPAADHSCAERAIRFYEQKLADVREQLALLRKAEQRIESLLNHWKKVSLKPSALKGEENG
jgi:DNA-binding transcriptional MerR regulator